MDAITAYNDEFPVSVWMRRVGMDISHSNTDSRHKPHPCAPPSPRVIVVIEPVERSSALFSLGVGHMIASCDPWFACLFGFANSSEVIGRHVSDLIPLLKLPETPQELLKVLTLCMCMCSFSPTLSQLHYFTFY